MIHYFSEDITFHLSKSEEVRVWVDQAIKKEHHTMGDINYIFTSDEYLRKVNVKYLNHNYLTDVITFDYTEKDKVSGDIFISIDRIEDNASELNTDLTNELHRVMIHGVLHLLGYRDKTTEEQQVMRQKEDYYLSLRPENLTHCST